MNYGHILLRKLKQILYWNGHHHYYHYDQVSLCVSYNYFCVDEICLKIYFVCRQKRRPWVVNYMKNLATEMILCRGNASLQIVVHHNDRIKANLRSSNSVMTFILSKCTRHQLVVDSSETVANKVMCWKIIFMQ